MSKKTITAVDVKNKFVALRPEYQTQFSDSLKHFLDSTQFDGFKNTSEADMIPLMEAFAKYRQFALMHESPALLNVDVAYFGNVMLSGVKEFTLNFIVTFLRASERRTLKDWLSTYGAGDIQTKPTEYMRFAQFTEDISQMVNPIIDEKSMDICNELLKRQTQDIQGKNVIKEQFGGNRPSIQLPAGFGDK